MSTYSGQSVAEYYRELSRYWTANVALLAVGTVAGFGLWVYGCCLKRSVHDLGRFMHWARWGLGALTIGLLFDLSLYAVYLAVYHGAEDSYDPTALQHLNNFSRLLQSIALAFLFLGIVALSQRIALARTGIASSGLIYASYAWAGIMVALSIVQYGLFAYAIVASDRSFYGDYDDINWDAIEAHRDLNSATQVLWFVTALVSLGLSVVTVVRHRVSAVSSAALLAAAIFFLSPATYLFAVFINARTEYFITTASLVLFTIFYQLFAVLAFGSLVLAGARGVFTSTRRKTVHEDVPVAPV